MAAAAHVVTRFEDAGVLRDGDLPPETRLTCIPVGRSATAEGPVLELLGLLEGADDMAVGRFLLRWNLRQGLPASVLGGPFALRLPLVLARVPDPETAKLLGGLGPGDGLVLVGTALETWRPRPTGADHAGSPAPAAASVRVAAPSRTDLECWEALRLAADVGGLPAAGEAMPGRGRGPGP